METYPTVLILTPTYNYPHVTRVFLAGMRNILENRPSVQMCILDNDSDDKTKKIVRNISPLPNLEIHFLEKNNGKGNAMNHYIRTHIQPTGNVPDVVISLDPDLLFSLASFDLLVEAAADIPNLGILGMRYENGSCNPERWVFFPPRSFEGRSRKKYPLRLPFLHNVAGPILAIPGRVLRDVLHFELYPKAEGKTYYPDDAFLYDKLKKNGLVNGYLEGTSAIHLKSGPTVLV